LLQGRTELIAIVDEDFAEPRMKNWEAPSPPRALLPRRSKRTGSPASSMKLLTTSKASAVLMIGLLGDTLSIGISGLIGAVFG
jgi:hypothetical protein